jgi:hypothetical protein
MIMAFRKHDYDLDNFERCEEHGCPLVQVAEDVEAECLVEWVAERVAGRQVVDVVPPSTQPEDYPHPALVLEGGMILPVVKALDTGTGKAAEVSLGLTGWAVSEVAYVVSEGPGGRMEYVTVELTDGRHAPILAGLNLNILIYLLEDAQFRRIEP